MGAKNSKEVKQNDVHQEVTLPSVPKLQPTITINNNTINNINSITNKIANIETTQANADLADLIFKLQEEDEFDMYAYHENTDIIEFLESLISFNNTLKIPFIDPDYANKMQIRLMNRTFMYDWHTKSKSVQATINMILNKAKFRDCNLYNIILAIIAHKQFAMENMNHYGYHRYPHYKHKRNDKQHDNFVGYSLEEITDAINEVTCSSVEYICKLIDDDTNKLLLYLSLENLYTECTMHNLEYSNFKKIMIYLTDTSDNISEVWKEKLDKLVELLNQNDFANICYYLQNINGDVNNDNNVFTSNDNSTDKISNYFGIILDIVNKSTLSVF